MYVGVGDCSRMSMRMVTSACAYMDVLVCAGRRSHIERMHAGVMTYVRICIVHVHKCMHECDVCGWYMHAYRCSDM